MSKVGGSSGGSKPPVSKPAAKPAASTSSSASASKPSSSGASSGSGATPSATGTPSSTSSTTSKSSSNSSTTSASSNSETEKSPATGTRENESSSPKSKNEKDDSTSATRHKDSFEKSGEFQAEKEQERDEPKTDTGKLISNIRESYRTDSKEVNRELEQVEQKLEVGNIKASDGARTLSRLESDVSDMSGEKKEHFQNRVDNLKKDLLGKVGNEEKSDPVALRKLEENDSKTVTPDLQKDFGKDAEKSAEASRKSQESPTEVSRRGTEQAHKRDREFDRNIDPKALAQVDHANNAALNKKRGGPVPQEKLQQLNPTASEMLKSPLPGPEKTKETTATEIAPARFDSKKAESLKALERNITAAGLSEISQLSESTTEPKTKQDPKGNSPYQTSANFGSLTKGIAETYGPLRDESLEQARSSKLGDKVYDPRNKTVRELGHFEGSEAEKSAQTEVKEPQKTDAEKPEAEKSAQTEVKELLKAEAEKPEAEKSASVKTEVAQKTDETSPSPGPSETSEADATSPVESKSMWSTATEGVKSFFGMGRRELTDEQKATFQQRLETSEGELQQKLETLSPESSRQLDTAFETALGKKDETLLALESQYSRLYPPDEAKARAEKALESKENFYSSYLGLHENARGAAKAEFEKLNPAAAELAVDRLKDGQPPATASLTGEDRVKFTESAIKDSFQELASTEQGRETLKGLLTETFKGDEVDPKKIDDIVRQAQEGKFPMPGQVEVVAPDDPRLERFGSHYDAESKSLLVSENVAADPARLQRAMFSGSLQNLADDLGAKPEGNSVMQWLGLRSGERSKRVFDQVQSDVSRRTNESAAATHKSFQGLTSPETREQTRDQMAKELTNRLSSDGKPVHDAQIKEQIDKALNDESSFGRLYNYLYSSGDEAAQGRLRELSPEMATATDDRLKTDDARQRLAIEESVNSAGFERYRDAGGTGERLDALHHIDKGFALAQKDDGQSTIAGLQRAYEERGLSSYEALSKAQNAVANEKNLYSQYSALYRSADDEGKKQLRELNPDLASLVDKENNKSLRTDEQWRQDIQKEEGGGVLGTGLMASADSTIAKVEGKLTSASDNPENRTFADHFQNTLKERATQDEAGLRDTLKAAFPKAGQESLDRLVELAKEGNFPLAENVRFVDETDPRLNKQNASFDSDNNTVYIDKALISDPNKAMSAYLEENGHHLDSVLGGRDSRGDEGQIFKDGVLEGRKGLERDREKREENDHGIVIMPDGTLRIVENQHRTDPVTERGTSPVDPTGDTIGPDRLSPRFDRHTKKSGDMFGPERYDPGRSTERGKDRNFDAPPVPDRQDPGRNFDKPPGFGRDIQENSNKFGPGTDRFDPGRTGDRPPDTGRTDRNFDRPPDTGRTDRNFDRPPEPDRTERNFDRPPVERTAPPREVEPPKPRPDLQTPDLHELKNKLELEAQKNAQQNEIKDPEELRKLEEAAGKLKDLPQALGELEKLKSAFKDLGGLSKSLDDLKSFSKSLSGMKDLSSSLETLQRLGSLQTLVKELPEKLANLEKLPQALETLGDFKKTFGDLNQLPKMMEQMKELPKQMSQLENLPKILAAFNRGPDNLNGLEKLPAFLQSAIEFAPKKERSATRSENASQTSFAQSGPLDRTRSTNVPRPIVAPTANTGIEKPVTSPYAGRFGNESARLGPNIGTDASRHNQARKGAIAPAFGTVPLRGSTGPAQADSKSTQAPSQRPQLPTTPQTRQPVNPLNAERAAELRQLPQRLEATARQTRSTETLQTLQREFGRSTMGLEKLPSALSASESVPRSISDFNRLSSALGKKEALSQGLGGLRGLSELAKDNPRQLQGLQDLAGMLSSAKDRPDTLHGMARMPALVGYLSGVKGDSPEAMVNLLRTVQAKPEALEGLKAFNTLMTGLRENPQLSKSLDQLSKMVQSGEFDKLSQSSQKLTSALANPQSVFGLDKLETMARQHRSQPGSLGGLERFGGLFSGREKAGTEGMNRLSHLLGVAQAKPNAMQSMVDRALERSVLTGPSTPTTSMNPSRSGEFKPTHEPTRSGARPLDIGNSSKLVFGGQALERLAELRPGRGPLERVVGESQSPTGRPTTAPASAQSKESPTRLRDYRQAYNALEELKDPKSPREDHALKLREMSASIHGAQAVADAFEAKVIGKPEDFRSLLDNTLGRPESARSLGQTLANLAERTPDRLVGILLLANDQPQGKQTVANLFSGLASNPQSASSLGKILGSATRTELGAAGMKELLGGLVQAEDDPNGSRTNQTARALAEASRQPSGSRGVAEGLLNLTSVDGGSREIGSILRRMNSSPEGSRANSELLLNLARDRQGAGDLGRVLSRAGRSQAGGRDLLVSFQTMAKTEAGKTELSQLMLRLTESEHGAKMLANLTRDRDNAQRMTKLLQSFQDSPSSGALMRQAVDKALQHPQARQDMEAFRGRLSIDVGLREALENLSTPSRSQPFQLSQSVRGADAMARVTAFETLARAVGSQTNHETPISTVKAAEGGSAGSSAGSGSGQGGASGGSAERPAFSYQSHPYPDLAVVSDAWRQNSAGKAAAIDRLAEQAQSSHGLTEQPQTDHRERLSAFRPGDIYSDMTLLRARICGDCGFRTNSIGQCGRCGFSLLDDAMGPAKS